MPVSEGQLKLLTWAVGLMTSAFLATVLAGIPWAMVIQSDVKAMQVDVRATREKVDAIEAPPAWFKSQVDRNTDRIESLTDRVGKLERQ